MIIITKKKLEEIKNEYTGWCKFEIRRAGIEAKARAEMEAFAVGNKLKAEMLTRENKLLEIIRETNEDLLFLAESLQECGEKNRQDREVRVCGRNGCGSIKGKSRETRGGNQE